MVCKVFLLVKKKYIHRQNMKVYYVNSNFLSKSSIIAASKYYFIDEMMIVTKKVNKHI